MLEVQKYLKSGKTYEDLKEEFGISATFQDDLVILNYSQIDSPKMHPIVQECRGICLHKETFELVAIAFPRFFNEGEALEVTEKFDWKSFSVQEKCDGSLIKIFCYNDKLHVQTRGSFADSELIPGKTWRQAVLECLTYEQLNNFFELEGFTFVFEYCGPFNQVVRIYQEPKLVLLTINRIFQYKYIELPSNCADHEAKQFGFERPERISGLNSVDDIKQYIQNRSSADNSWEGVVVRDDSGMRLKIKSATYLQLHHMSGNGNIFLPKNLLPFILAGETDEVVTYFPAAKPFIDELQIKIDEMYNQLYIVWAVAKDIEDQKNFALYITKENPTPFASILFKMRQNGLLQYVEALKIQFRAADALILKNLKEN